jgi:glycosyltransferase involved in cell wall biosynthesis
VHVVLDARSTGERFPGISRYVTNLTGALVAEPDPIDRLSLLLCPSSGLATGSTDKAGPRVNLVHTGVSPFSLAQQWAVPRLLHRQNVTIYHSPYYLMPYRPGKPTVLTIYDLIPALCPAQVSPRARVLFRLTTRLALSAATRVIAISDTTRRDLIRHFGLEGEKVSTVHLAADARFGPVRDRELPRVRGEHGLTSPYVLYVGINKPHKNLLRLIQAWGTLQQDDRVRDCVLAIAGPWDPRYPEPQQWVERLSVQQSVRFLGRVDDHDLPGIYCGALALVIPSLYEGFGLPVLEAMACGTPVVCAKAAALQEVAGDAALFFDPLNVEEMAGAVHRVIGSRSLRDDLGARGLGQAARFSWEGTATQTKRVYGQALA